MQFTRTDAAGGKWIKTCHEIFELGSNERHMVWGPTEYVPPPPIGQATGAALDAIGAQFGIPRWDMRIDRDYREAILDRLREWNDPHAREAGYFGNPCCEITLGDWQTGVDFRKSEPEPDDDTSEFEFVRPE